MPEAYSFEIVSFLRDDLVRELDAAFAPMLDALHQHYGAELKPRAELWTRPQYLDYLRTEWILDERPDRLPAAEVTAALGYGYGQLLMHHFPLRWARIRDPYEDFVGLAVDSDHEVMVPPWSFVAKREEVDDPELFEDGLEAVRGLLGA